MLRAIASGGLVVGALDLIDAFVFFGVRSGARPIAILHSIAAGVLGVTPVLINGLLIHAFGVGLPAAYFSSRRQ